MCRSHRISLQPTRRWFGRPHHRRPALQLKRQVQRASLQPRDGDAEGATTRAGVTASGALTVFGCRAALYRAHAARPHRSRMPSQLARSSVRVNRMYPSRRRHAHQERHLVLASASTSWTSRGTSTTAWRATHAAQQVFVTAQELTALAQMFRDGGQVVFNDNGGQFYFVTERQDITARAQVDATGPGHHGPKRPSH